MSSTLREISFTICPRHFSASCTLDAMLAKCGLFALSSMAPDLSCSVREQRQAPMRVVRVTLTQRLSMDCAFSSFLAIASSNKHLSRETASKKKEKPNRAQQAHNNQFNRKRRIKLTRVLRPTLCK
jgi:hypothetical protein